MQRVFFSCFNFDGLGVSSNYSKGYFGLMHSLLSHEVATAARVRALAAGWWRRVEGRLLSLDGAATLRLGRDGRGLVQAGPHDPRRSCHTSGAPSVSTL